MAGQRVAQWIGFYNEHDRTRRSPVARLEAYRDGVAEREEEVA